MIIIYNIISYTITLVIAFRAFFISIPSANESLPNSVHVTYNKPGKTNIDIYPIVKIIGPTQGARLKWGSRIHYRIEVADKEMGEVSSAVNPNSVLLEVEYVSAGRAIGLKVDRLDETEDNKGLALIRSSACFSCHADKSRMLGPSFEEMAIRYGSASLAVTQLSNSILKGSSEKWGEYEMPAYSHYSSDEVKYIADYILEQGGNKNRWVIAGLEGVIRVIDKPKNSTKGKYFMRASYVSPANKKGYHTIVLEIE